jgi:hypothetical protein
MQNPCVQLFRVSHDRTARSVVYALDRQPVAFPTLDGTDTKPEMFGNLFPTRQNHGASILAQPGSVSHYAHAERDIAHDKDARSKFNQQATESMQRHRDDLAHSKQISSDAALNLKQREKHRRKAGGECRARQEENGLTIWTSFASANCGGCCGSRDWSPGAHLPERTAALTAE